MRNVHLERIWHGRQDAELHCGSLCWCQTITITQICEGHVSHSASHSEHDVEIG